MHPRVWEASGHIEGFTDPLVDCKSCKQRFRADQLAGDQAAPSAAASSPRQRHFNLMFRTFMGPVEDTASTVYLRPETAQGIFVNFQNVLNASRLKLPFGIGQIGKSFRNEITPGNFLFRTREFEQMEMEFFVKPGDDQKWHEYWKAERFAWYQRYGITRERLRLREHGVRRAGALRQGLRRRRVRVPVRLVGARGHREPRRLRPEAPHRVQRQGPLLLRRGDPRALHAVRDRAVGRRRPTAARVPGRRLRRGRRRRRGARRAAARSAPRTDQVRGLPAAAEGGPTGEGARRSATC